MMNRQDHVFTSFGGTIQKNMRIEKIEKYEKDSKGGINMQKNRIELAGFLAAKPEVRHLPSGTPVANARLAEGYRYTDRNNQPQ